MPQTINTNIASLTAQRNLNMSQSSLTTSLQRLSSGLRINSAKDDAAGLAISQRMTAQINGLDQAGRNANDGISLAQTAEGALSSVSDNLQRMRELSVQSANATNSASDRAALQQEVSQLASEIDRVATQTQFNGTNLLDGTFTSQQFQVGANAGQTITVSSIASARTATLGQGYAASTTSNSTLAAISASGTLLVNGTDVYQGTAITQDAQAITNAINARGISGVTATAAVNTASGTAGSGTAAHAGAISINGVNTASLTATGVAATDLAAGISAVNQISAATGVTATDGGGFMKLTAVDGRNLAVAYGGTLVAADVSGVAAGTTHSTFTLNSTNSTPLAVTGSSTMGLTASTNAGLSGTSVANLDISTVAGANAALASIDNALNTVNSSRAALGAYQNRFTSVISSLQTTSENLSDSRSRIQDTDFAAETANLTRSQILQQAGTAMLAQANALPQNVLSLLK